MLSKLQEAFDGATCVVFGSTTVHFAMASYDVVVSRIAAAIAIIIGIGKIIEMVTGRKVSSFFKRKGKQ